jgi:hypothetical protein
MHHISATRTNLQQIAQAMSIRDQIAYERQILSQAAFLSSGLIARLLGPTTAPRRPAPEVMDVERR